MPKKCGQKMLALSAAMVLALGSTGCAGAEGSWGSINQEISRAEGWQDYVQETDFSLGEGTPYPGDETITVLDWGTYPSIDGSTVCVPMAMELARQHLDLPESDLNGFVAFSTTHHAYERLIGREPNPTVTLVSRNAMLDDTHPVDLFLGTEPSDEERAMAAATGVELVMVPVCYDAFVFLVNGENPVESLTVSQIRAIYTGDIQRWQDVGGEDRQIIPYQRPKNSGSQTAMENLVMQGRTLTAEGNYISDGMGDLVSAIGDYDNGRASLGYSYLYYVDVLYKSGSVKVLAVDGVKPTAENLRSGAYPFTTCYYAVYRAGDEQAAAFADWLVSEAGQRSIAQAGYVPIMTLE